MLFFIPIIAIVFAISAVREDIEENTIVYLITRPISKFELLLFKYKGFFISTWVPIALSLSITFFIVSFTEGTPLLHIDYLLVLLGLSVLAVLAYGAIFFVFAVSLPYPSIISFLYLLFWEITLIPNQPNILNRLSITYHLQSIAKDMLGDIANVTVYQPINSVTSFFVIIGVIVAFFGMAIYLFSYRDFT
jgi:ABC-2 type transport system permease protein